jgi:hypothetical protein
MGVRLDQIRDLQAEWTGEAMARITTENTMLQTARTPAYAGQPNPQGATDLHAVGWLPPNHQRGRPRHGQSAVGGGRSSAIAIVGTAVGRVPSRPGIIPRHGDSKALRAIDGHIDDYLDLAEVFLS